MSEIKLVLKSDGTTEPFNGSKLKNSLTSVDASVVLANEITDKIKRKLSGVTSTEDIYNLAFKLLKKTKKRTAARYSMKRSLLDMGPTGFPFEKFIAKIFDVKNYQTIVGMMLGGSCTEHEVDVIAGDEDDLLLCEVKFHNDIRTKTDTKVALYVKARYDDLSNKEYSLFNRRMKPTKGLIITNTRFTTSAEKYAKCVGLGMISWDYPKKGNLYDLIEETNLQPITSLISLTKNDKKRLIMENIIDCRDLLNNKKVLYSLGLNNKKTEKIIIEAKEVCSN
jgi:hypothetical protein